MVKTRVTPRLITKESNRRANESKKNSGRPREYCYYTGWRKRIQNGLFTAKEDDRRQNWVVSINTEKDLLNVRISKEGVHKNNFAVLRNWFRSRITDCRKLCENNSGFVNRLRPKIGTEFTPCLMNARTEARLRACVLPTPETRKTEIDKRKNSRPVPRVVRRRRRECTKSSGQCQGWQWRTRWLRTLRWLSVAHANRSLATPSGVNRNFHWGHSPGGPEVPQWGPGVKPR